MLKIFYASALSLLLFLVVGFTPTIAHAESYTVTTLDDELDGSPVCTTGSSTDCSLREAVTAANSGGADTIVLPANTYHITRTGTGEDLGSTGDFDFTDTDMTTVTGADMATTIIDPDDLDRAFHVTTGAAVTMSGLTVNDSAVTSENGAGVLSEGPLTLSNVTIQNSVLNNPSGIISQYGAGMYCAAGTITLTDVVVSGNTSGDPATQAVFGGGIAVSSDCTTNIIRTTISGNSARTGGGMYVDTSATTTNTLTDVEFSNNTAASDAGGGIFVQGDDNATPININRALFQDNDASTTGGGVFATGPLNILNASFYGNHAGDAGGAFGTDSFTSPEIHLAFVTMTRNTADSAGPGLYVGGATPNTHIKNSIVASNNHTADINDFEDCSGVPISDDYNYIAATASCDMIPAAHDIVGTEAGSVYFTATPVDDGGDVFVTALWETGVTLDMIPSASCTDGNGDPVTTDASGRSRPQNVRCDLGAHEKLDTVTLTPTLTSPTSISSQNVLNLQYTLPEVPSTATVTITNGSSVTRVLTMNGSTSVNTNVDLAALGSTVGVTGVSGGTSLPDGTYTVTLSYLDALSNPIQSAVATSVTVDTVTQSPTLTLPSVGTPTRTLRLQYSLPETPSSATITITNGSSVTRVLTMGSGTSVDTTVNLASLESTSNVASVSGGSTLPDGIYTVTLSYRDSLVNPASSASASGVTLDTETQTPTLTSPTTGTTNSIHLEYTLPEAPSSSSVSVVFTNTSTAAVTTFTMLNDQSVDITFNPTDSGNAVGAANITKIGSISPSPMPVLADGTYTVRLQYQDFLGNTARTATASNVVIDTATQAPVVTGPTTGARLNSPALIYTLPESPQGGSVRAIFNDGSTTTTLTMDNTLSVESALQLSSLGSTTHVSSSTATTLADGTYTVTVQYRDALGNAVVSTIATGVVIDTTAPTISLVGATTATITAGGSYTDPGFTATDAIDGNLHDSVTVLNTVNANIPGTYTIYYSLTDGAGNLATQQTRTVTVVAAAVVTTPVVETTPTTETTPTDNAATDHGVITTVTKNTSQITVVYANAATRTLTPFGGSTNFRVAVSTDKKRIIATNGKEIRVFQNGSRVARKTLNGTKFKSGTYTVGVKSLYSGYDTIVVMTVKGKSGYVYAGRLTTSNAVSTVKSKKTTIQNGSALALVFNKSKKQFTTTFGKGAKKTTAIWSLKSNGTLALVK